MNRVWLIVLIVSLSISSAIFVSQKNFLPLYVIPWILGVGGFIYLNKEQISGRLNKCPVKGFGRFILLGLLMILIHEVFVSAFLYLTIYERATNVMLGIWSSLWLNSFSLLGYILTWYFLRKYIFYTTMEVFILAGLFGVFLEEIYISIFIFPLANLFYILPTMFAYALILAPSIMSFRDFKFIPMHSFWRYSLGFFLPVIVSIVLVSMADNIKYLFF